MSRLTASRAALDLIESFEGFRARAARLPSGRYTIGFGHVATAREGASVTRDQAEHLLLWDLRPVEDAIRRGVHAPLTQGQFDALVSFVFNIGIDNFLASGVLRHINAGEPVAAALAMGLWRRGLVAGRLIVVDALVRRRAAEAALFLEPSDMRPAAPSPVLEPHPEPVAARAANDAGPSDPPVSVDPGAASAGPVWPSTDPAEAAGAGGPAMTGTAMPDGLPADGLADPAGSGAAEEADPVAIAERIRIRVEQILAEGPRAPGRADGETRPAGLTGPAPVARPGDRPGEGQDAAAPAAPGAMDGAAPRAGPGPIAATAPALRTDAPYPHTGLVPFPAGAVPPAPPGLAAANALPADLPPAPANDGDLRAAIERARAAPDPTVIVLGEAPAVADPLGDTPEARLARLREKIAGGGASIAPESRGAAWPDRAGASGAVALWNRVASWAFLGLGLGALVVGLRWCVELGLFQVTQTPAPLEAGEQAALGAAAAGLLAVVVGIVGLTGRRT